MRKQYYLRPSPRGLLAWDVDRLVELSRHLPVRTIALSELRELDEPVGDASRPLTWWSLVEHVRLIDEAEPSYPIILAADGAIMDGRHRVAKALRAGLAAVLAVRFEADPEPDFVGREPDELPC